MKVVRAAVNRHGGALSSSVGCAAGQWTAREGLCLRLFDGSGRTGIGEASPLPGHSPDSLEDALVFLRRAAELIVDTSVENMEGVPLIKELQRRMAGEADSRSGRFALETAVLDLQGQQADVPLWQILGGCGCFKTIGVNALVDWRDGGNRIESFLNAGIRAFKVKVGIPRTTIEEEMTSLRKLRNRLGDDVEIRLDANGVFQIGEAMMRMHQYAQIKPAFIEEPVKGRALSGLERTPVSLAADESLADESCAEGLLACGNMSVFVLKPALLGGLLAARHLARAAQRSGKDVVITHMYEGPIALRACTHLAFSLERPPLACGLLHHPGLDVWPPVEGAPVTHAGLRQVPRCVGLGVDADAFAEACGWMD